MRLADESRNMEFAPISEPVGGSSHQLVQLDVNSFQEGCGVDRAPGREAANGRNLTRAARVRPRAKLMRADRASGARVAPAPGADYSRSA